MELKQFIKTAINDIIQAADELQEEGIGKQQVCPPVSVNKQSDFGYDRGVYHQKVEFDVLVAAETETSKGGGMKLSVAGFGVGGEKDSLIATNNTNRIKFHIPIGLRNKRSTEQPMTAHPAPIPMGR